MRFADAIRRGVEIVKLDREAFRATALDPTAFTPALGIAALVGVAAWLSPSTFHVGWIITGPLLALVELLVGAAVIHFFAILFGGQGEYLTLVRVWGTGWVIGWAHIVPILGSFIALWRIVIAAVAVEEIYGLERARAVLAVLVPVSVASLIALIVMVNLALHGGLKAWLWLI
jgi:hypothetical protein